MSRGVISFVFDDGYESVHQRVVPALQRHGFKGVFALPLSMGAMTQQTGRAIRPWQEWLPVQQQGHELAAHSVTHRDMTTFSPEELHNELKASHDAWGATTLVYPGGAHNEAVRSAAASYFTAARSVRRGLESLAPTDHFQLKTYNFSKRNFSLYKANILAVWAWITGRWLIETYHLVDDNETQMVHTVPLGDFKKHLAFVARLPLVNKTIYETVRDCYR